jgi:methyltransferase (TIGR00027 family)
VFEVDHPASQLAKRDRLARAGIELPQNLTFAPVDFEHVPLRDGLADNGVSLDEPIFFSWLGVTMYLTRDAVDAVFRTVSGLRPTTQMVFTFAQPRRPVESGTGSDQEMLAERAAAIGEPWLTFFEPRALDTTLHALGFSHVSFLTPAEAKARYFGERTDGLPSPRRTSICDVIV